MKNTLFALGKSIAVTAGISCIIGAIALYTGYSFAFWFTLSFFVQFLSFYLLNTYLEYKARKDTRALLIAEAQALAQNTMKVECASCKKESEVIVKTNIENRYICGHCNAKNSIYIFAETAVVTEPLYETEPLPNTQSTNGT